MQILDSKLSKLDSIQLQLGQTLHHYEELLKHFHSHSLKIEQLGKTNRNYQSVFDQFQ